MNSEIRVYPRERGEHQRVQCVRAENWETLEFFQPEPDGNAFHGFAEIYRTYLVPAFPWIFGSILLIRLPRNGRLSAPCRLPGLGYTNETLLEYAAVLRSGVQLRRGKPVFHTDEAKQLYEMLRKEDCLEVIPGKLPVTKVIPVNGCPGKLSESERSAALKVNASFFIMDYFDAASPYDTVGTPFGLAVKDGSVLRPPLFGREALIVRKNGAVTVEKPSLDGLSILLRGVKYRRGENCELFTRPECRKTPRGEGTDVVIVGTRVKAVRKAGGTVVPASGFVLRTEKKKIIPGEPVRYVGMEDVLFGIQVGSSVVCDGQPQLEFGSAFYNLRRPGATEFPPSLYPLDYQKDRAARIALGADAAGKPMIVWAEGAAKLGHTPGKDSCGASLSELAEICADLGMVQGVNLDGGGSAQLLLQGERSLEISDRDPKDHAPMERAVPSGLLIR